MKWSDQTRAIVAAGLSLAVIIVWSIVYKPPKPEPQTTPAAATGSAVSGPSSGASRPATPAAVSAAPGNTSAGGSGGAPAMPTVMGTAEQTIVVESDLYRVELSTRGAVVHSWQLKKYTDDHNPPRTLDVVNPELARQTGGWPFSLQMADTQTEAAVNEGLYVVNTPAGAQPATSSPITAPAELEFHWSNGQVDVTKRLKFERGYVTQLLTSVKSNGQDVPHRITWRGGFGDETAYQAAVQRFVFTGRTGKITPVAAKNVGVPDQRSAFADVAGTFDTAGIEDLYFAAAFMPPSAAPGQPINANLTMGARQLEHETQVGGKTQKEILPEVAIGTAMPGEPLDARVFVGPKDLDTLKAIRPPLNGLVQFGWTGFIAEPLLYILLWLHRFIPNYGWAIVGMTIAINMLLYPLKVSSWRSMQKIQRVAPEIRSIQDRYKKYSVRDPRKQEMNKEVMAVYSREGINPLGSCLPMVAQFPIWFGLNRMLTATLELRHAPWFGWIHDLSARDPYYILPVSMAVLMYIVQKMTPVTTTDPSQQRMMTLTPLIFGGMFIVFPISSGLAEASSACAAL